MKQILINSEELQVRVAVVEDGTLQDFFMERTNKDRIVGSIYKGKIKNLEPSLQAAFVDIGVGKNAFLHYWDMLPATLEKLEGDGDDDDEPPVKPGQERAEADQNSASEEDSSFDPPSPPETDESGEEEPQEEEETPSGDAQDDAPPKPPVTPSVVMDGKEIPDDTQLTKGLIPLHSGKSGLIPLGKPQPPASAQKPAEPEKTSEVAEAAEASEAPVSSTVETPSEPQVEHYTIDENPPPKPEEQSQGGHKDDNRSRQRPQRDGNQGRAADGGNAGGGHRRRRRRGGRDNSGQGAPQTGEARPSGTRKPGVFRRLLEFFFPGLKGGPRPAKQQPKKDVKKGTPLSVNSGKNELLPLTSDSKPSSGVKPQSQQPAKQEKQKQEKAKKPEKKGPTVEDIPNLFKVDQEILVQVTKGPIGTKGARVTTNISIPGRYLVLLPNCPHVGISRRVEDKAERSRLKQMIRTILPPNMGVICRTEGVGLKKEHFQRDLEMLLDAWRKAEETAAKRRAPVCVYQEPALVERTLRDNLTQDIDEIVCDTKEAYNLALEMLQRFDRQDSIKVKLYSNPTPIFIKYGISQQIEGISNRKVPLPSGGYLCIDETEALIAIDVNTGKNRSGKDQPETILATNMEAVKEIARQLRLRNIGGLVVLDLIDMRSRKDQMAVYRAFKQYTSEDHARIKLYPISGLGLLEMSRQRESESLESTIYEDCPYCKGRGLIKTATSVSVEIQRRLNELLARKKDVQHFVITVHPKILERLRTADHKVMNSMAAEYNRQLTFNASPELHIEAYRIADRDTGKVF